MTRTVEIVRMGHAGHGVTADGIFVPYTVPGDIVRITPNGTHARLEEVLTPGSSRTVPACRHFGTCGGCALQMMRNEDYLTWKRGLVVAALNPRGFSDPPVEKIVAIPPGTRRRAIFKARKLATGVAAGFYEADSHRLVDIQECPLLVPELASLLEPIKTGLAGILVEGEQAELHATASDTGIDLSLKLVRRRDPNLLMELSRFAADLKLARLCWKGEPVVVNTAPQVHVGRFSVSLPPESFLQPSKQGERVLQQLARAAAGSALRIADLFCGCGSFTFAFSGSASIAAFDSSGAQVEALRDAARPSGGKIRAEIRDLFRQPLTPAELDRFDAVLLDPPRAGAPAQARNLARSAVPSILYISCNPASFARDARILCDGGYRLLQVVPVDQFLWSPHIELFALFNR
jgi:23S rRNA (uracil1939-C5)-methyltransferase